MNFLVVIALFAVPALGARLTPLPELLHSSYIINGNNVDINDFPHQGSLKYFGSHSCGCAFIGGEYALTAAHCVGSPSFFYEVQFGSSSQNGGDMYAVEKITKNPNYSQDGSRGFPNDIAILKLGSPVDDSLPSVQKIRIATPEDGDFAEENCYITGWGLTRTGGAGGLPSSLQGAEINVLSQEKCNESWDNVDANMHVCVGGQGNAGSCNGDSGGPLTCRVGNEDVLVGVTSWGINGCYTFFPSVYTRVSNYASWVKGITGDL